MNGAYLVRRMHEVAAGPEYDDLRSNSLTQQMINQILNNKASRSYFVPIIAAALRVSAVWLAFGIGDAGSAPAPAEMDEADWGRRSAGSKS